MFFTSTRSEKQKLKFLDIILKGTAENGGLFMPQIIPQIDSSNFSSKTYQEVLFEILKHFCTEDQIPSQELWEIIQKSYQNFHHAAIAPLRQAGEFEYVLELFYGPTFAFKDFALQLLGNLIEYALKKTQQTAIIIGATSGDTGSAAICGLKNIKNATTVILHPHNRTSLFQRKQMTTTGSKNIKNIALEGTFDDCQAFVKEMFAKYQNKEALVSVNSINFVRILAQTAYYFYSASRICAQNLSFCVPTGNFGNIYAGYLSSKMGLKIHKLICATNENNVLHRFFSTGDYSKKDVLKTHTPSMDIAIASNLERLTYKEYEKSLFDSGFLTNAQTLDAIIEHYNKTGIVPDPHSAISYKIGNQFTSKQNTVISLATAHPVKFLETIKLTGLENEITYTKEMKTELENQKNKEESFIICKNNYDEILSNII